MYFVVELNATLCVRCPWCRQLASLPMAQDLLPEDYKKIFLGFVVIELAADEESIKFLLETMLPRLRDARTFARDARAVQEGTGGGRFVLCLACGRSVCGCRLGLALLFVPPVR